MDTNATLRRFAVTFVIVLAAFAASCGGDAVAPTPSAVPATVTTAPPSTAAPPTGSRLGTPGGSPTTIRPPDFEPLPGAKASFGTIGKAAYRIEMPGTWNGDLVLYAHGVRLTGTEVYVSNPLGPLRQLFIDGGYAWAASSYSENFYVPGIGADETVALLARFEADFGKPRRVYLVGESMGGNVIALLLEHFPEKFDGALAVCGALGGEEQLDYLVSWAMAAEFTSGVTIPIGGGQAVAVALVSRLAPALGSPSQPTASGRQFESIIRNLTGGPRPFFAEGFAAQFQANFGLLALDPDRRTLPVAAATNEGAVYDVDEALGLTDAEVNTGVRRLPADPAARDAAAHPDAVPTSGRIDDPLLTLHNTGDLFVPITHQTSYRQKVEAAGKGDLLVQRAIRAAGHCQFSDAEYTAAWNDLTAWV
ncbi:MAG: hypothetical protein ACKVT1_06535, partial [Dehalococcoidia bacterium]